jgi:aspartyl-tRNA(Asn)/glutamyl-tRNA(Gln) amidotransferase subunit A
VSRAAALLEEDLAGVAAALGSGETTSRALTEACLERIAAEDRTRRAFVAVEPKAALAAAAAADRRRREGLPASPIDGVPVAHKDVFLRGARGVTAGSSFFRPPPDAPTATALARLEAAGAVALGTLNLAEFAAYSTGENPHFGDVPNPYDPARIAGGSSSGSAAAVAAGFAFGGLATDTGGSIRNPAALCGVTGLKTTYGLVSRHGVVPRAFSLDTVGVMARSAAGCALLLDAIAGPDPSDPTTAGARATRCAAALTRPDPAGRLAVPVLPGDLHPGVRAALEAAVDAFAALGAEIVPAPALDLDRLSGLADAIMKAEAAAVHGRWMRSRPGDYHAPVFARNEAGFHLPAACYVEALAARGPRLDAALASAFAAADVLLLPAVPVPAPRFDEVQASDGASMDGIVRKLTRYLRPINYLGLPALALPCGATGDGLPIALQLVGRPFGEPRLVALGHRYQSSTAWHRRRPRPAASRRRQEQSPCR